MWVGARGGWNETQHERLNPTRGMSGSKATRARREIFVPGVVPVCIANAMRQRALASVPVKEEVGTHVCDLYSGRPHSWGTNSWPCSFDRMTSADRVEDAGHQSKPAHGT